MLNIIGFYDFIEDIKNRAVFIYPTDTICGLGCDAANKESVKLIKDLKYMDKDKPMSVIAPSIKWIKQNYIVTDEIIKKYLPGPYTLILKKKNLDGKSPNKEEVIKKECYVFDFAPNRALKQIADYSCKLNIDEEMDSEKKLKNLLISYPFLLMMEVQ